MMKEEKEAEKARPESLKTVFLFSMFGFLSYLAFGVIVSSAQEILTGHTASTSMIWICLFVPMTILPTIIPYIFDRLPPLVFILILSPLHAGALACLLLADGRVWLKYLAICLIGSASVIADVTGMSLTAYFDKTTVTAYCSGTGVSFIFGPLFTIAMTSWVHSSYKLAVCVVFIAQPVIYLMCFLLLENRRENARMGYRKITDEDPDSSECLTKTRPTSDLHEHLTFSDKLSTACHIFPDIFQIFLGIAFHDFVLSGVTTTIAFSNSPFSPTDDYKYYLIISFTGLFIGRSYLGLADYIRPGLSDKCLIRQTWLLVVISAWHVIMFVLASLYRFLPNVWCVLVLVFTLGIFAEAAFANLSVKFGEMKDQRKREFAMGLAIFGMEFGSLIGVILAAPVEKLLLEHCLFYTNETTTCITRDMNLTHIVRL